MCGHQPTPSRVEEDDDYGMTPFVSLGSSSKAKSKTEKKSPEEKKQSAIDITAEDLIPRLTPQNVADLVLLSMVTHYLSQCFISFMTC